MRRVVLSGIKNLEMIESPKPKLINDNDVLLRMDTIGICGSDVHYYKEGRIGDQVIKFPFTIGHEGSAWVEKTGKNVSRVKSGDLVAIDPAISCGKCSQCLDGREHTCTNQKFLGSPGQIDGCLAEYVVLPDGNCYPVPENLDGEDAALVEPLSIGYYAAQFLKNIRLINSIGILGVGPIGLSVLFSLHTMGYYKIYVTDKLDYRLRIAETAGAIIGLNPEKEDIVKKLKESNPELFDVIFECCGKQEALDQAVELLKPGGTLLIVGIPETDRISFDISKIRRKEITIQNVRRQNHSVQPVIDLSTLRKWSPNIMVTHRFSAEQANEAFNIVCNYKDGVIKALIKF
ncbi:MAG: zinc-dependent alcohol dehydrogenase [Ignavibacteriaceae bacterium]